MIFTVFKISLWRLWNNKQELVLALVVPVMFFSIFALIFSRGVGVSLSQVRVSFVDDDKTLESRELIKTACKHDEFEHVAGVWRTSHEWPIDRLSRLLISQRKLRWSCTFQLDLQVRIPKSPTWRFSYTTKARTLSRIAWSKLAWQNPSLCFLRKPIWRPLHHRDRAPSRHQPPLLQQLQPLSNQPFMHPTTRTQLATRLALYLSRRLEPFASL